ncbi:uncharacterized protein PHACADRAFT_198473 [Phanerochaete carnosa HHB-10118-sp]|uniref:Fungal-type protein kinase domain-containing protein n=1 Tax=Phanerochaete carnosa (strain HHB-10118-sp) TaxID=650164 RepID=K5VLW8_PHACS|nr:uncharacterized protein PHACADRAFT_198473 [Phanerochaete carnosa HHB-10118-sp]EKM52418.1 hypothetical protein PHACADRAFT_198473 [Phanerochaete carnosa HHB-10118-sp]
MAPPSARTHSPRSRRRKVVYAKANPPSLSARLRAQSPYQRKISADAAAVGSEHPAPKSPAYPKEIGREMESRIVQVAFDKMLSYVPGDDMTETQAKRVSSYSGLEIDLSTASPKTKETLPKRSVQQTPSTSTGAGTPCPPSDAPTNDTNEEETKRQVKEIRRIEKGMYQVLTNAGNDIATLAKSKVVFKIVADVPESGDVDMRPDVASYYSGTGHKLSTQAYKHKTSGKSTDVARCAWAWMLSFIEVKPTSKEAGFWFPPDHSPWTGPSMPLLVDDEKALGSRAQFFKYATELMVRQHRTHLFAVYVAGSWARLFRFDRAGCIVTEPISLLHDGLSFQNFHFRLLRSSREVQGYDTTVKLANSADIKILKANEPDNEHLKKHWQTLTNEENYRRYPVYKVECPMVSLHDSGSDSGSSVDVDRPSLTGPYLIGKSISSHYSPTGRCTRGFIAFDLGSRRMVFFKDQWRSVLRPRTELDAYRRLHRHHVRHIATPIAGGDVEQYTLTQELIFSLPKRVHTRFVTKEVGRPLEDYDNAIHLLEVVGMALLAHKEAWEKAEILHRDVSVGNIMIGIERGTAFLNDWDLCKYKEDLTKPASDLAGISGTWPFKSAMALGYPLKPPEVADDLESFIYVILFMAFRFHLHDLSPQDVRVTDSLQAQREANAKNDNLATTIHHFFYYEEKCQGGYYRGGQMKKFAIVSGTLPIQLAPNKDGSPMLLTVFLQRAYDILQRHYCMTNLKKMEQFAVKVLDQAKAEEQRAEMDKAMALRRRKEKKNPAEDEPEEPDDWMDLINEDSDSSSDDLSISTNLTDSNAEYAGDEDLKRPLDTHTKIWKLFKGMFRDKTRNRALPSVKNAGSDVAKFIDQFSGQPVLTLQERRNPTGQTKSSKSKSKTTSSTPVEAGDVSTPVPSGSGHPPEAASAVPSASSRPIRSVRKKVQISDETEVILAPKAPEVVRRQPSLRRSTRRRLPVISEEPPPIAGAKRKQRVQDEGVARNSISPERRTAVRSRREKASGATAHKTAAKPAASVAMHSKPVVAAAAPVDKSQPLKNARSSRVTRKAAEPSPPSPRKAATCRRIAEARKSPAMQKPPSPVAKARRSSRLAKKS